MAHMIMENDSLFVGSGEPAWHGLGTVVEGQLTAADAIKTAGLDWTVSKQDVVVGGSIVPGYKAIVRDDKQSVLSIMGDGYEPFQNKAGFTFADSIVGAGNAMYESAGSLNNGRRIWVLAKLPQDIRIEGTDDVSKLYLLFANSHDGTLAQTAKLTATRVCCNNTLSAALADGHTNFKVRHTKNAETKLQDAARVLGLVSERFKSINDNANRLAKTPFTEKQMKALAEILFPANSEGEVSTRSMNNREDLVKAFDNSPGAQFARGSAWNAENAVSFFTDHQRGTRVSEGGSAQENKLNSIWFGAIADMKIKASQAIQQLVMAA